MSPPAEPTTEAPLPLAYVTPERTGEFLAPALHAFYEEFDPEASAPALGVVEPDRSFGGTVQGRWVSTCAAYTRTMTVPGGSVPVAAVSLVTVAPSYRRRGLLRQMMRHQLDDVVARGTEPVALLWASESGIFGRFGYGAATSQLRLSGATRETGYRADVDLGRGRVVEVDPEQWRAVAADLHARLLPARPGALDRPPGWWAVLAHDPPARRQGGSALRYAVHRDPTGVVTGYVAYRRRTRPGAGFGADGEVLVTAVEAADAAARARLWRFVLDLDLVRTFRAVVAPDEPLVHLLEDPRAVTAERVDGTYARLVDVPRALAARACAAPLDLVLGVRDDLLPGNDGCFRLRAEAGSAAQVERVDEAPDVQLAVRDLGALYLGGTTAAALAAAGLVSEHRPGTVAALSTALSWPRQPYCPDFF